MSADQLIGVINTAGTATINAVRVEDPASSDTNARIAIYQEAETSAVGTRRALRFIEGADADFTIADDSANEEVDITLAITSASANTADRIVKRDSSGNFAANVITCVDLNSTSDAALKQNISPIDNAIDLLSQITGVSFDWAQDQRSSVGVLAWRLRAAASPVGRAGGARCRWRNDGFGGFVAPARSGRAWLFVHEGWPARHEDGHVAGTNRGTVAGTSQSR